MIWHRTSSTFTLSALAIVAMLALSLVAAGCSSRQDESQEVGTVDDYMSQGQNYYGYGYGYDPYGFGYDPYWAYWYPVPVYYYSRGDGDHDCDDGNCGGGHDGHPGQSHQPPHGTFQPSAGANPAQISAGPAHSSPIGFGHAGFGGGSSRSFGGRH